MLSKYIQEYLTEELQTSEILVEVIASRKQNTPIPEEY